MTRRAPCQIRATAPQQANCKHENLDISYGMAGGGIGAYTFCLDCDLIIEKVQDPEMTTPPRAEDDR